MSKPKGKWTEDEYLDFEEQAPLRGGDQADIAQTIEQLALPRQCTGCQNWYQRSQVNRFTAKCRACGQTESIVSWEAAVSQRMAEAPKWLSSIWQEAISGVEAASYVRMAQRAKRSLEQFKADWQRLALPDRPAGRPRTRPRVGTAVLFALSLQATSAIASPSVSGPRVYIMSTNQEGWPVLVTFRLPA